MLEYRIETSQYERLPQPPHTPVSITKRMDELKFIMKNAAADKKMVWGMFQPTKQVLHKFRYTLGRRGKVNTSVTLKYANSAAAEASRIIHQGFHHHSMRFKKVFHVKWI